MSTPKQRFICYVQPMVKARRAGRKSQTRRVFKEATGDGLSVQCDAEGKATLNWQIADVGRVIGEQLKFVNCPLGKPGDQLIIKEATWMWCERVPNGKTKLGRPKWLYVPYRDAPVFYQADYPTPPQITPTTGLSENHWGWRLKVPRFVPGWACRSVDEIVDVRVEMLNSISETDAMAEGVVGSTGAALLYGYSATAIERYRHIWELIYGVGTFNDQYVWVISCKTIQL